MKNAITITRTVSIKTETCCRCGCVFGMEEGFMRDRRNDHQSFYCPNGHGQHYTGKTDAQKAREEADSQRERALEVERWWRQEQQEHARTELSRRAYKGQVTKIKRRVGKGVCPCCNRTFANLASHMTTQHPDWSDDDA